MSPIFQKIKAFAKMPQRKISYKKDGMYPLHDWKVVFLSSALALAVLFGLAGYLYLGVSGGTLFTVNENNTSGQINIDDALFQKTIQAIHTRMASSTEIKNSKVPFPDPSI